QGLRRRAPAGEAETVEPVEPTHGRLPSARTGPGVGTRRSHPQMEDSAPGSPPMDPSRNPDTFHATTIVSVRRNGRVVVAGDGQVLAGFAGAAADAFTLFELFEAKLEKHGQLTRAAVELAKDWRTERRFGKLEALLVVADAETSLVVSGTGDVIEPEDGLVAIGSGGSYALA